MSGIAGSHVGRVDMNNGHLPDISVTLEDGRDLATALGNNELGDADFGLHYIGLSGTDVTDEVDGLSVDGELDFRRRRRSRRCSSAPPAPVARRRATRSENDIERRLVHLLQPVRA